MVRMLVVLLWISLVIGTYVTGNVLGNWLVCLLGLYTFIRSRPRSPRRRLFQDHPCCQHAARDRSLQLPRNRRIRPLANSAAGAGAAAPSASESRVSPGPATRSHTCPRSSRAFCI